MFRYQSKIERR